MAPKLDYSMINGVGMWPLKKPFHIYLVLLVQRNISVAGHLEFYGGSNQWKVSFAGAGHD
jgi:hypothetical protein